MSREDVQIVRQGWDAWGRRDLDDLFAVFSPAVVWDLTHFRDWPDSTYEGHQGTRQFLAEWLEVWEGYEAGVDEIVAAPDGRVVVLAWQRGSGRQSGLPMAMEWAQVMSLHAGKITRVDNYDDRSKALEAVGLSE
jgi:ketosteroid isomerase-like protein